MKMLAGNFYDIERLIKDKDIVESMFSKTYLVLYLL